MSFEQNGYWTHLPLYYHSLLNNLLKDLLTKLTSAEQSFYVTIICKLLNSFFFHIFLNTSMTKNELISKVVSNELKTAIKYEYLVFVQIDDMKGNIVKQSIELITCYTTCLDIFLMKLQTLKNFLRKQAFVRFSGNIGANCIYESFALVSTRANRLQYSIRI